jgi:hypothetical protein
MVEGDFLPLPTISSTLYLWIELRPVNLRKFYRFCLVMLVAAVAIGLVFPQLLNDPLLGRLTGRSNVLDLAEIQQIAPPTPDRAWGETGATVLPFAAQIMAVRNPGGVSLSTAQKSYLRPLFGDLVDRVTVVYEATLLDRWSQGGKETHIGEIDSAAQTYCDRIYIRAPAKTQDTDRLVLLAHELAHSKQCRDLGGIGKFGFEYFRGYYQGGQTYENNPLEQAARSMELKFAQQLCTNVGCPPIGGRYYVNYKGWGLKLPVKL